MKYLVQNRLSRLWMEHHPDSPLKAKMEYYIEPAEQTPEVQAQLTEIIRQRALAQKGLTTDHTEITDENSTPPVAGNLGLDQHGKGGWRRIVDASTGSSSLLRFAEALQSGWESLPDWLNFCSPSTLFLNLCHPCNPWLIFP